jgi:5-aminopentanamidase
VRAEGARRVLRLALLHLAPELGELQANRSLIETGTRVAAQAGAEWVLSGELVISGYRFEPLLGTSWITEQPDTWMRRLARQSAELGVASFVSHPERDNRTGALFNSFFAIDRRGRIVGRQRKLMPTPVSEKWASPGEEGPPIVIDGISVGLLICADAYSPLPAQRLRAGGAELLLSCAAWWPGEWGPKGEWEARTLDTGLPLVVCNRSGLGAEAQMAEAESVIVDHGRKLLILTAPASIAFVVELELRCGRIQGCELVSSTPLDDAGRPELDMSIGR